MSHNKNDDILETSPAHSASSASSVNAPIGSLTNTPSAVQSTSTYGSPNSFYTKAGSRGSLSTSANTSSGIYSPRESRLVSASSSRQSSPTRTTSRTTFSSGAPVDVFNLQDEIISLKEDLLIKENSLSQVESQLKTHQQVAKQAKDSLKSIDTTYEKAKGFYVSNDNLQSELHEIKKASSAVNKDLENTVSNGSKEIASIHSRYASDHLKLVSTIEELEEQIRVRKENELRLKKEYDAKVAQLENSKSEIELKTIRRLAGNDGTDLADLLNEARDIHNTLRNVSPNSAVLAVVSDLQTILGELKNAKSDDSRAISEYQRQIDDLFNKLNNTKQEAGLLAAKLAATEADIALRNESINNMSRELSAAKEDLNEKENALTRSVNELRNAENEKKKLSVQSTSQKEVIKQQTSSQVADIVSGLNRLNQEGGLLRNLEREKAQMSKDLASSRANVRELEVTLQGSVAESQRIRDLLSKLGADDFGGIHKDIQAAVETLSSLSLDIMKSRQNAGQNAFVVDNTPFNKIAEYYQKQTPELAYKFAQELKMIRAMQDDRSQLQMQAHLDAQKRDLDNHYKSQVQNIQKSHLDELDRLRGKFETLLTKEEQRHQIHLEKQRRDASDEVNRLRKAIGDLEGKLGENKEDLDSLKANTELRMQTYKEEIIALRNARAPVLATSTSSPANADAINKSEAIIKKFERSITEMAEKQQNALEDVEKKHFQDIKALETKYQSALDKTVDNLNAEYKREVGKMMSQAKDLHKGLEGVQGVIQSIKMSNSELSGLKAKQAQRELANNEHITDLQKKLAAKEKELLLAKSQALTQKPDAGAALDASTDRKISEYIKSLEGAKKELENALARLHDDAYQRHLENHSRIRELESLYAASEMERKSLQFIKRDVDRLEKCLNDTRSSLEDSSSLRAKNDVLGEEVSTLKALLQNHPSGTSGVFKNLETKLASLESLVSGLNGRRGGVEADIARLTELLQKMKDNSDYDNKTLRSLEDEIAMRSQKIDNCLKNIRDLKLQPHDPSNIQLDKYKEDLARLVREHESSVNRLNATIRNTQRDRDDVQENYTKLLLTHDRTAAELQRVLDENKALYKLLNEEKEMPENNSGDVISSIRNLREEYITQCETRDTVNKDQIDELKREFDRAIEESRRKNRALESSLYELQSTLAGQFTSLKRMQEEFQTVETSNVNASDIAGDAQRTHINDASIDSSASVFGKLYDLTVSFLENPIFNSTSSTVRSTSGRRSSIFGGGSTGSSRASNAPTYTPIPYTATKRSTLPSSYIPTSTHNSDSSSGIFDPVSSPLTTLRPTSGRSSIGEDSAPGYTPSTSAASASIDEGSGSKRRKIWSIFGRD